MKYSDQLLMMPSPGALIFLALGAILAFTYIFQSKRNPQPPGPWGLPIIGHLHLLGNLPHRSLYKLSQKFGPIMQLRLGSVPTIVVSSPQTAELFLKTHDLNFASRPKILASEYLSYGYKGLVFSEYGSFWRNLRKLCTLHLLSSLKMGSYTELRRVEVMDFIRNLKAVGECKVVDISAHAGSVVEKISYGMILGTGYRDMFHFKPHIEEAMGLSGTFNLADYLPFLKPFDIQGINRRLKVVSKILDGFQEAVISAHEKDKACKAQEKEGDQKDFIDIMLSLMKSDNPNEMKIDRDIIKAVTLDMLAGSMHTTATLIEWTLTDLLMHPEALKKVQDELATVVGLDRMVEESDLAKLVYLEMVVKENMRLRPIAPLLVMHQSVEDISVGGYFIPKKSRIIVSAWAIGRDPDAWPDKPDEFYPERFVDSELDIRGHDIQLIPFGAGRRICPGMELGIRTVQFILAQLLHCFELVLPDGMSCKDVDTEEKFGLAMPRANPLLVLTKYRLHVKDI